MDPVTPQGRNDFKIAIICALKKEAESVRDMFDKHWEDENGFYKKLPGDKNSYIMGAIGQHNVILVHLTSMSGIPAAQAAASLCMSFPNIKLALVVGICGVVPVNPVTGEEIILGDIVISNAMVQYDYGSQYPDSFKRKTSVSDSLRKAPKEIQGFMNKLSMRQTQQQLRADLTELINSDIFQKRNLDATYPGVVLDHLYDPSYLHQCHPPELCDDRRDNLDAVSYPYCDEVGCEQQKRIERQRHSNYELQPVSDQSQAMLVHPEGSPSIHFGRFGSANTVMKSGLDRDKIANAAGLIAFEMEGAGVWDELPTIVIKAACDYADSHKNKVWQPYAAVMAAACLKVVLKQWVAADEITDNAISYIPLDRMSNFVGRSQQIAEIKQKLFDENSRRVVSILGLGGIGKSRLALETAYQIRSEYPQCSIFWVQAQNLYTFESDIRVIGKMLGISGIDDEKADVKNLFKQWLSNTQRHRWLLILDNADDVETWGKISLRSETMCSLVEYLPKTSNGSILITTRTRDIANLLSGKEIVRLDELSPQDSLQMFVAGLENPQLADNRSVACTLMEELAYLPLAIVQASSYINETEERVEQYLDLLCQSEEHVIKLLSEDVDEPYGYQRTLNPVATTWWVSFQQIRRHYPLAAKCLSWMSCLHEKHIPKSLLPVHDSFDASKAMGVLMGYSFVHRELSQGANVSGDSLYNMHRLVRTCTRNWLRKMGDFSSIIIECASQAASVFPWGKFGNKSLWTMLLAHGKLLCEDKYIQVLPERYDLMEKIADCLMFDGQYSEAAPMLKQVTQWRLEHNGNLSKQTIHARVRLASALKHLGEFSASEKCLQQSLDSLNCIADPEDLDTLCCKSELAMLYLEQGRWKESEVIMTLVVETEKKVLGEKHLDINSSMNNLAGVFHRQGRYEEAEAIFSQVLENEKLALGKEHPSTVASMSNLASVYATQSRWRESELLLAQVVEIVKKTLGEEHPSTLTSMGHLGLTYIKQGFLDEAEPIVTQVLEKMKQLMGEEHHSTLTTMGDLALLYTCQGRQDEALTLSGKVLRSLETSLGEEHPHTIMRLGNFAAILSRSGLNEKANTMFEKALKLSRKVSGECHPSTIWLTDLLTRNYHALGRHDEEIALMAKCVEISYEHYGREHFLSQIFQERLEEWSLKMTQASGTIQDVPSVP